jgi:hypothetical protein
VLRDHLLDRGTAVAISQETLRRTLRETGISWQTTTTWKASTDPDFLARIHYRTRSRKRHGEFLDLLTVLVMDDFSPHRRPGMAGKLRHPAFRRFPRPERRGPSPAV